MKEILIDAGFPLSFEQEVLKEVEQLSGKITREETTKRKDCRDFLTKHELLPRAINWVLATAAEFIGNNGKPLQRKPQQSQLSRSRCSRSLPAWAAENSNVPTHIRFKIIRLSAA